MHWALCRHLRTTNLLCQYTTTTYGIRLHRVCGVCSCLCTRPFGSIIKALYFPCMQVHEGPCDLNLVIRGCTWRLFSCIVATSLQQAKEYVCNMNACSKQTPDRSITRITVSWCPQLFLYVSIWQHNPSLTAICTAPLSC